MRPTPGALADDAALRNYLWKSEGALFALAAQASCVASQARDVQAAALPAARPTAWRASCWTAARLLARARAAAAGAPGLPRA